jgi:ketosteroid isomerase-like protein
MSSASNLDLVRSIYADWERGKFGNLDWADAQIEFVFADGPEAGTWKGSDGLAHATRQFLGAWDEVRIAAESYHVLADGSVLVIEQRSGRGKTSGIEFGQAQGGAHLFEIAEGKVTKLITYWTRSALPAELDLDKDD